MVNADAAGKERAQAIPRADGEIEGLEAIEHGFALTFSEEVFAFKDIAGAPAQFAVEAEDQGGGSTSWRIVSSPFPTANP